MEPRSRTSTLTTTRREKPQLEGPGVNRRRLFHESRQRSGITAATANPSTQFEERATGGGIGASQVQPPAAPGEREASRGRAPGPSSALGKRANRSTLSVLCLLRQVIC